MRPAGQEKWKLAAPDAGTSSLWCGAPQRHPVSGLWGPACLLHLPQGPGAK